MFGFKVFGIQMVTVMTCKQNFSAVLSKHVGPSIVDAGESL